MILIPTDLAMSILSIKFGEMEFPVLQVDDRTDAHGDQQLVLRFIHQNELHWTLHKHERGVLMAIYSRDFWSTWSDLRISAAKALGFKQPERHGHYATQQLLAKVTNMSGYYLGSGRAYLRKHKGDEKYLRDAICIGTSAIESPAIKMTLSTSDYKYESGFSIATSFGDVCLEIVEK